LAKAVKNHREKVVIPGSVVEHFIQNASFRFIMNACICRKSNGCRNYPVDLGCLFMGEAARKINPLMGREVSVEEAKAFQKRVEEQGLINLIGKNRLDKIWLGVAPENRLLTVCHCCECCCLWNILPHLSPSTGKYLSKLDGVEVKITGDCIGCGKCAQVCFARAISITNGKAYIGEECRGCGRCVSICPRAAISLSFEENELYLKCIESIRGRVDVF